MIIIKTFSYLILFGILTTTAVQVSAVQPTDSGGDDKICTLDYNPVCGIDGYTYGNKCMAEGKKLKYNGECKDAIALKKPCTREYLPVCGVDEKTYPNKCSVGDIKINYFATCQERINHPNNLKLFKNIIRGDKALYGTRKSAEELMREAEWQLISIDNSPIAKNIQATLKITKDGVSGSAGCNRYFGGLTVKGFDLKFSALGSTMMMCDQAAMAVEDKYLGNLEGQSFKFEIVNDRMILSQKGKKIFEFVTIKKNIKSQTIIK